MDAAGEMLLKEKACYRKCDCRKEDEKNFAVSCGLGRGLSRRCACRSFCGGRTRLRSCGLRTIRRISSRTLRSLRSGGRAAIGCGV